MLYERLIQNEIDAEDYATQKTIVGAEIKHLQRELSVLSEKTAAMTNKNNSYAAMQKAIKSPENEHGLNRSIIDLLVGRVYVYPGKHVEVEWKVADFTHK